MPIVAPAFISGGPGTDTWYVPTRTNTRDAHLHGFSFTCLHVGHLNIAPGRWNFEVSPLARIFMIGPNGLDQIGREALVPDTERVQRLAPGGYMPGAYTTVGCGVLNLLLMGLVGSGRNIAVTS